MDLTNYKVLAYPFEDHNGDKYYGFRVAFEKQNNLYHPFISHSFNSINRFIDHIDFAERIQDKGASIFVKTNAIVFADEHSAIIAAEALAKIVAQDIDAERKLYEFAKDHHFGQRANIAAELENRHPDGYGNEELEALYAELEAVPAQ